ncbi:MAG: hypothetical protein ACREVE_16340 [Gammaproteobacteria bacterium]
MVNAYTRFGTRLVDWLAATETDLRPHPRVPSRALIMNAQVTLDLTPFEAVPQPASAFGYFAGVANLEELLEAYAAARVSRPFESDIPSLSARVHSYAQRFLDELLERASMHVDDATAKRIGSWVSHLDVYAAVKTVESFLNNEHDCALLAVAEERGWDVHFDHVAIRCGSSGERAARRVVALLREQHGYVHCQLGRQRSYRFADGWRAYPLYKILENGLVLRLFLDESEAGHPGQIIQHWNRVYGYTAHHLALRVSRRTPEGRVAVTLPELEAALAPRRITLMTPTGDYTYGLLVQVFAQPVWNPQVPADIKEELRRVAPGLECSIENAKLIELVSRREMSPELANEFYMLYGLRYQPLDPQYSAPIYQYFLPAQAAHVIRTSVEARQGGKHPV